MNYGALKAMVQTRLNRRDVTPTLIDGFTQDALRKMQRLLRVPAMERTVVSTVPTTVSYGAYLLPGDYLKHISITVDGGDELARRNLSEVQRYAYSALGNPGDTPTPILGIPKMFARDGRYLVLGPSPQPGAVIKHVYLGDFTDLVNDTDENWVTDTASDILIAGALAEGCIHFNDPRFDSFDSRFTDGIVDLNNQAVQDELTSAQVAPAHHLADYWNDSEW